MITNEELSAIVDNYCRQTRKICDEAIYAKNDEVIEKVTKISKIAARINEIKSIQKSAKDNRGEMMEKLRNKIMDFAGYAGAIAYTKGWSN